VDELKQEPGGNLVIMGSGELIGSLMAADLIDEYLLMIHPIVLGTGRRVFPGHPGWIRTHDLRVRSCRIAGAFGLAAALRVRSRELA
jgi:dihydrofolate reductase